MVLKLGYYVCVRERESASQLVCLRIGDGTEARVLLVCVCVCVCVCACLCMYR
jgi:hypothetical protein